MIEPQTAMTDAEATQRLEDLKNPPPAASPFTAMDADAATESTASNVLLASDWLSGPTPPIKQLFPGLLDAASKLLVNGSSKCRKTFLVVQLAICAAIGKRFLIWDCEPMRVLFLQGEVPAAHTHRRLQAACRSLGINPRDLGNLRVANTRGSRFTIDEPPGWLQSAAAETDLLIIDPVYKYFEGEENSGRDAAAFLAGIDRLCSESGAAAVYVHHAAKGSPGDRQTIDRGSGSGVFARDFDASLFLGTHREAQDTLVVESILRAYPPVAPFCIEFREGSFSASDAAPLVQNSSDRVRVKPSLLIPTVQMILETTGPIAKTELINKVQSSGGTRNGAREAILIGISDGIFVEKSKNFPNRKIIQLAGQQTEGGE